MTVRRSVPMLAATVATLSSIALGLHATGSTVDTTQQVWTAEWTYGLQDPGRPYSRFIDWRISFDGVEDIAASGERRWVSRRWTWSLDDIYQQFNTVAYDPGVGRYRVIITKTCAADGTVELGPGEGSESAGAPLLQATCEEVITPVEGQGPGSSRTFMEPTNQPPTLSSPQNGCSVSEYSRHVRGDSVGTSSYALTVTPYLDAIVEVDVSEYEDFVPAPGKTLTVTAISRTGPVWFRFELDPAGTSRFPGYATNADIDDLFFVKHDLGNLRGEYENDDADVIFNPEHFSAGRWSRRGLTAVETRTPETGALVTLTAMDYGAVGRLRAFARSEGCEGAWQPVPVQFGAETRESISVPIDEDDNLIADALEDFQFLESGVDDDAEPAGNGFAGDGLTAFEEYRGFLVRGIGCGSEVTEAVYSEIELRNQSQVAGWSDEHIRTSSRHKDLFVHTPDPELALAIPAVVEATGVDVHVICEQHYNGNESRQVNFTLHEAGLRSWAGRKIAHEEAQHGLHLEPVDNLGLRGLAIPVTEGEIGPPKLTRTVQVTKPRPSSPSSAHRGRLELPDLIHTIVHELSHGIGVPHHGDNAENWRVVLGRQNVTTRLSLMQHAGGPPDFTQPDSLPVVAGSHFPPYEGRSYITSLLVEPGGDCVEGAPRAVYYRDGKFAGCEAGSIARRGEQNSGDFDCPMRYSGSDYYEGPGAVAEFRWTGLVTYRHQGWQRDFPGHLVDAWGGRLFKYRNEADRDGNGPLCVDTRGTGINDPEDLDHNGRTGRDKPCADFVVVSDLAARGVR